MLITHLFLLNAVVAQTTYYSRATGGWTTNTTWSLTSGGVAVGAGIFPVAGDIVNIEGGFNVNIPASTNAACATINITSANAGNGTLTFNSGSSLAVSGNISVGTVGTAKAGVITMTAGGNITCGGNLTIGSNAACNITQGASSTVTVSLTVSIIQPAVNNITNSWNVNAGTATVTGLFTLDGINTTTTRKSNLVITTGTFNANGGILVNGTTAATKAINMTGTSSVLNIGGSGINGASGATFTQGSGTSVVNYVAAGNQANIGNYTYFNLSTSGSGTKTLLGTTIVNGTLRITAGTVLALSTFNITPAIMVLECGAATGSSITGTGSLLLAGNLAVNDAAGAGTSGATISTPVVLGGNRTFTIADDGSFATDLTVSGIISGPNSITKAGTGTMELAANNTYSSSTNINAGILQYSLSNAIANGNITLNGGTLDIKSYSDVVGNVTLTNGTITGTTGILNGLLFNVANGTISAIVAGTGDLTKTTAGTVTLSAANTYTGATIISAGTLSINSMANFGTASSLGTGSVTPTISMGATAILLYTGSGHASSRVINVTANDATINASGTGTLTLSGGIISVNKRITLTGTGNAVENGVIAIGNGSLTKIGTGIWQLGAANSYAGLTTISAGLIKYASNNVLSNGGVTINGGTLDIATFTDAVGAVTLGNGNISGTTGVLTGTSYDMQNGSVSAILAGSGTLTKTTGGTVTMSGVNTYTGRTTISAGVLNVATIGDGVVAGNLGAASNAAANLVFGGGTLQYTGPTASTNRSYTLNAATISTIDVTTNNLTISGASTNTTGALTKIGSGTLILSGNNLHTGTTTITAGTLRLGAADRISNSSALVVNGTFDMGGFNETVASLSGAGTVTSSASGNMTLTMGNATSTTYSGVIQNGTATAVALTKIGTGVLTLSGNNTYSGRTTITAGTIQLGASNVLPNNAVTLGGGILNTGTGGGFSETIGDLTVSTNSSINLGTGVHTLTIANSSANTWSATTLAINGWTGTGGIANTATQGKIMVGTGGLSAAQFAKITFTGFNPGATITASGELVPVVTAYYSTGSAAPNVLTNWKTARNGTGTSPANFTSGAFFIIQNTHTMTTGATWSVSGTNSKVWIESGGSLVANNAVTLAAATSFQIEDNGTYIHNNTGTPSSTIFAGSETFGSNSNFIINNWVNNTTAFTTGVTLPYGNLEINWNAGGNWSQSLTGAISLTAGNFTITSLGSASNELRLTPASNGTALVLGIGGNLTVTSGVLSMVGGGGNGPKDCDINVTGNVSIAGTIDMNTANTSSGSIALNIAGNFSVSGTGVLKNSVGNGSRTVNFNNQNSIQAFSSTATGINTSTITFNAGTASTTNTLKLQSNFVMGNGAALNILNGTTLDCGTNIIQATVANTQGNFTLNSGAYILIGATGGISATGATGNIQTGTTRVFSATANYTYNGLSAQVSGTGLTAAANLEINNASGIILNVNAVVSDTLRLTSGNVDCGANTLSISNSDIAAISHTSGHVIGYLKRAIATGANVYDYPVGTVTGYVPISLDFSSVSGAGSITIRTTDGAGGNYPVPLSATKKLNRDWAISNSGVTGFAATANFTFLPGDLVGGATAASLKAYRIDPGPVNTYTVSDDYDILGNTFSYYNLSSFSNTAGLTEFGAGECKAGFAPTFIKTMASACAGGADGTITVTPLGGTAPYTYSWTGVGGFTASTSAITGLGSGDYTVVIAEVTGCSFTIPDITIWQALAPVVTNNGGESSSCGNTGYIILYGSYGVQPYTYSIDGTNYSAGNSFINLPAGTYIGYVKDRGGCVSTKPNIIVTQAPPIVVTSYSRAATSCANNGSIELYRTGGIPPYSYSLNDVTYQSGNVFSNLSNGTYTGWVKDSKGCKSSLAGITVTKAAPVTVTARKTNTSACSNTGYIELVGGGGVPGYTYSLNNVTYQSSNAFSGLAAGSYNGWVQDSKGCKTVVFGISIGTDAASVINVTSTTAISSGCSNTGSIQLFRSGGFAPFTYSLNNVTYQASNTFTGLATGTYTGWIKDAKGCKASKVGIVISQASAVTLTASHTNSSTCTNDGTIQLRPAGGTLPYTYSLNNITYQAADNFSGLAAGNYTCWVKDVKGCKVSVNRTIGLNPIAVTAYASPAGSCAISNGSIQIFRTGGSGPYTYSLDGNNYQSSNVFTNLVSGNYTCFVKDSKTCVGTLFNVSVGPSGCPPPFAKNSDMKTPADLQNNENKELVNNLLKISAYPNPSATEFTLVITGSKKEKVSIIVSDVIGKKVYQAEVNNKQSCNFGKDFKPGLYIVQVILGDQKQNIKVIKE